jgi:quercetin dioxygenase-like cupin family protein
MPGHQERIFLCSLCPGVFVKKHTVKLTTHAEQEPAVITPDGARRRVLSYGGKIMLVEFSFDAGVSSWLHSHPHEQVGYVVSGEIDFNMEGHAPVRLQAGGSYYVPPDVKHNITTFAPTVLIDVFTPIRDDFLNG